MALTVGELKKFLKDIPDDTKVCGGFNNLDFNIEVIKFEAVTLGNRLTGRVTMPAERSFVKTYKEGVGRYGRYVSKPFTVVRIG